MSGIELAFFIRSKGTPSLPGARFGLIVASGMIPGSGFTFANRSAARRSHGLDRLSLK